MKSFSKSLLVVISLILLVSPTLAFAEESDLIHDEVEPEIIEQKPATKAQLGVIATTGSAGGDGVVDVQTQGAAPGDVKNPIAASVSRTGKRDCTVRLVNTSKESSYSISYNVIGTTKKDGRQVFKKYYSAYLSPAETTSKKVACREDLNMAVELVRARPS